MTRYRLTAPRIMPNRPDLDPLFPPRETALVWVDSEDFDRDGLLRLECEDETLRFRVDQALLSSYGDRGRPVVVGGPLSPRDLSIAMQSRFLQPFEPVEVSPG